MYKLMCGAFEQSINHMPVTSCDLDSRSLSVKQLIDDATNFCIYGLIKALCKEDDVMLQWELIGKPLNESEVREKEGRSTRFLLKLWCRMELTEATIGRLSRALTVIYGNGMAEILENIRRYGVERNDATVLKYLDKRRPATSILLEKLSVSVVFTSHRRCEKTQFQERSKTLSSKLGVHERPHSIFNVPPKRQIHISYSRFFQFYVFISAILPFFYFLLDILF